MKKSLLVLSLLFSSMLLTGQIYKISGQILESGSSKPVPGAIVLLKPGNINTYSGQTGAYSFTSKPGSKQIEARILGYKPVNIELELQSDTIVDIYLQLSPFELSEILITGDSTKIIKRTDFGNFVITPAAIRETPRLFSEPDLIKSLQMLPGVSFGKEGTSDIYVRGGGAGQNVVVADGCYFFLPGHLLGIVSPFDLDFLESAELYKDYIPAETGGGASSIIDLDFRKPHSDSLRAQLRLGLLSSGVTIEKPFKKINLDLTAGLKRGNYSLYAPLLKKMVTDDVGSFLPPNNYSFYDSFVKATHESKKTGRVSYLFFGNYDKGTNETSTTGRNYDTLLKFNEGISTGWISMVHALQWEPHVKGQYKWKMSLNYNRLSIGRRIYSGSESMIDYTGEKTGSSSALVSFYPTINNLGFTTTGSRPLGKTLLTFGISERYRTFISNNYTINAVNGSETRNELSGKDFINETSVFFSSTWFPAEKLRIDAGIRLSGIMIRDAGFFVAEPRVRLSYGSGSRISPHITYVRLSQNDHAVEGSNAGLRTQMWLPLYKNLGPETSDILSAGFQGKIRDDFTWSLDGYIKKTSGMLDYKPGASFIFDTSFVDMVDRINLRAYGVEAGIIKQSGRWTGSASYTWSRAKREWYPPEGLIWIPSSADRPHNLNISMKYYIKKNTSFGINFVYQSGAPATIYMHETSYGEFFETKNNIRYFDYHRLDLSFRRIILKRRYTIAVDADIYNVYNHKNTFYFKKIYDSVSKRYYFKSVCLFPIMPTVTVTIKF